MDYRTGPLLSPQNDKARTLKRLVFDELAQAGESRVPLLRDEVEVAARVLNALLVQLPEAFASAAFAAHQTGVLHHAQVLGDGLAGEAGACRKFADGC